MVNQVAAPGVEHPHHAQLSAHEARGTGQVLHRFCQGTEEQTVHQLMMAAGYSSEIAGQGEGGQKATNGDLSILADPASAAPA
jgi:hypothetical protein